MVKTCTQGGLNFPENETSKSLVPRARHMTDSFFQDFLKFSDRKTSFGGGGK